MDEIKEKETTLEITDKLRKERQLAMALLLKNHIKPTQNLKTANSNSSNLSCLFGDDKTNFMNYRDPKDNTFDISELALSKTIEAKTPVRYSFEPSEISGRSTLQCDRRRKTNHKNIFSSPSVEEILATSCSEEVRNMYGSESKPSLPRTADISNVSLTDKSYWDQVNGDFNSEFSNNDNDDNRSQTSFRSAEEVYAKLIEDELKWQEEFAIIPETRNNNESNNLKQKEVQLKEEIPKTIGHFKDNINLTDFSGFFGAGNISLTSNNKTNEQMSISSYFNKNSDDLKLMIPNKSPIKNKRPTALIDSSYSSDVTNSTNSSLTPINDRRKENPKFSTEIKNAARNLIAMDEGNTSIAIKKFIESTNKIEKSKQRKTIDPLTDITEKLYAMELNSQNNSKIKQMKTIKNIANPYTEFSENLQTPLTTNNEIKSTTIAELSDTASFTDSLLDLSAFQSKTRSPSPSFRSYDTSSVGINTKTYNLTSITDSQNSSLDERNLKTQTGQSELIGPENRSKKRSRSSLGIITPLMSSSKIDPCQDSNNEDSKSSTNVTSSNEIRKSVTPIISKNLTKNKAQISFEPISPKQQREYIYKDNYKENCVPGLLKATQSSPLIQTDLTDNEFSLLFASSSSLRSPIETGKLSLPVYSTNKRSKSQSPSNNKLTVNMRTNSQCSTTSSEYNERSDILPIKSTHGELSWGSVKLRKTVEKSIQIKNISPKRLSLRLQITGPGFQLSGSEKNGILILQGLECRSISFVFCPTVIGPAAGQLLLQPSNENTSVRRTIRLYGYGGHTNISMEGVQKGPIGSAFLPLGDIKQLTRSIDASFILTNKGTLSAFASIEFQTKGKDIAYMNPSLFITPQKLIIPPQNSAKINIKFKPCREELKKLIKKNADVVIVSNLVILTGDEPCRHRIRKLIKERKANDKNISQLNYLCTKFYHENPTDIINLKESANVVNELISTFRTQDLALTINRNMDDTIIDFTLDSEEESILFHTIASETQIQSDDEINQSDTLQSNHRTSGESWSVQPKFLEFIPYSRDVKVLKINSKFYTTQLFELSSNVRHLFAFTPREGEIKSGSEKEIQIRMMSSAALIPSTPIIITILIENESITVPVYIKHENFLPPMRSH